MEERMVEYTSELEEIDKKVAMEHMPEKFDRKIETLTEKAYDMAMKYGVEDFRSQMMINFLDMAFVMKDAIELITAVNVGMNCMQEAMQCIDEAINFSMNVWETSYKTKYGFFANLKRKYKIKKSIRNNIGRINMMFYNIMETQKMTDVIVDEMQRSSENMQRLMHIRAEKRQKRKEKANNGTPVPPVQSKAAEIIAKLIAERNSGETPAPTAPTSSFTSTSGSVSGGGKRNPDDYSDILG